MYTIAIFISLAFLVVLICIIREIRHYGWNHFDYSFWSFNLILSPMAGFILGLIVCIILPMDLYVKEYSWRIETLQDNSNINGSFYLGSGNINGAMQYVCYRKLENENFKMEIIPHEKGEINYSTNTPQITVREISPSNHWINKFAIDLNLYQQSFIIEIPKGTIKNQYNLDAK